MDSEELFVLGVIGIPVAGVLIAWLGHCWFRYRQAEVEAALKQEMLQRGMPADDIARVLKASRPGKWERLQEMEYEADLKKAELKLKQEMLQRGMSADDIVRVLACGTHGAQDRLPEPTPLGRTADSQG
jgi:hypothetical protein